MNPEPNESDAAETAEAARTESDAVEADETSHEVKELRGEELEEVAGGCTKGDPSGLSGGGGMTCIDSDDGH